MNRFFCLLCAMLFSLSLEGNPWGKDADLVNKRAEAISQNRPSISLSERMIRFHQEVISPSDGPRSHFIPSSSQYTLEAMQRYGFIEGFLLGCDRLMRENDDEWVYRHTLDPLGRSIKYDPVQ